MSNFEALYRSTDRLKAAIKKAEEYLLHHPGQLENIKYELEKEICGDYSNIDLKLTSRGIEVVHGEPSPSSQYLRNMSITERIYYSQFIPALIEKADASLLGLAEDVESTAHAIEHAISVSEASRKPKTKSGKKTKQ